MLVHERQHDDVIPFDHVEERIPKPAEDRPPDFTFDPLVAPGASAGGTRFVRGLVRMLTLD
jgi:hypothetical protein